MLLLPTVPDARLTPFLQSSDAVVLINAEVMFPSPVLETLSATTVAPPADTSALPEAPVVRPNPIITRSPLTASNI